MLCNLCKDLKKGKFMNVVQISKNERTKLIK